MQSIQGKRLAFGVFAVAALAGGAARAGNFVYTSIDVPGANATFPESISDTGEVAGVYTTSEESPQYGFVWLNGTLTTFTPHIPSKSLSVGGIDDRGAVAFSATIAKSGASFAKLRRADGAFFRLPTPPGAVSWATGMNAEGQVVGATEATGGATSRNGFLFRNGQLQDIVYPGAALTTPSGIATDGTVVGSYSTGDADPAHGFIYQNGSYQSFDPPKSSYTIVDSINPHGEISGTFYEANLSTGTLGYVLSHGKYHMYAVKRGKEYVNEATWAASVNQVVVNFYNLVNSIAFTYVNGQYTQVLPFASQNSYIYAGNRNGTLVGIYDFSDGFIHGFAAVCPAGQAPCTN
jgi:probable HAF family extracellular repeat protein